MDDKVLKKLDTEKKIYFKKVGNLKHIFFVWILFSCFFWAVAYSKPFHVDEFYSWVYAERCTFGEILKLKDSGIGHPPLFHLIQKGVQKFIPSHNFVSVRFANFLFGSIFIIIFTNWILKRKGSPFFCYGAAISATMLDTFIFSRMYGLVCLSSLLLLQYGEKYFEERKRRYLLLLMGVIVLGFFADYNFILLVPYVFIVLFSKRKYFNKFVIISFILLIVGCFTTLGIENKFSNLTSNYLYEFFYDLTLMGRELGSVIFNFWFAETILGAFIILLLAMLLLDLKPWKDFAPSNKTNRHYLYPCLTTSIMFIPLNVLISDDRLRMIFAAPIIFSLLVFLSFQSHRIHILDLSIEINRMIITVAGACLIILCISPIFRRPLIDHRFLLILYPFLLIIFFRMFSRKALNIVSIILAISGIIYLFSDSLSDYYQPHSLGGEGLIIFEDEFSMSTQYIKSQKETWEDPYLIQPTFKKNCRVCAMGRKSIDFSKYDDFRLIGRDKFKPESFIPPNFILAQKIDNLTLLDRIQFKYLTPLHPVYMATYYYKKIPND
jgi:hypothetical protein